MYRVSISIVALVAMWVTIILQWHTIHVIKKRKVPDEPFDKDINVRSKDEPQTCSVSGRPYSECSDCEHFRCTADEPQTKCNICYHDKYCDIHDPSHDFCQFEPQTEREGE